MTQVTHFFIEAPRAGKTYGRRRHNIDCKVEDARAACVRRVRAHVEPLWENASSASPASPISTLFGYIVAGVLVPSAWFPTESLEHCGDAALIGRAHFGHDVETKRQTCDFGDAHLRKRRYV